MTFVGKRKLNFIFSSARRKFIWVAFPIHNNIYDIFRPLSLGTKNIASSQVIFQNLLLINVKRRIDGFFHL